MNYIFWKNLTLPNLIFYREKNMAAELSVPEIAIKKPRVVVFRCDECVFCGKCFSRKYPRVSPNVEKLDDLFNACSQRKDEVAQLLLENKFKILNKEETFEYHRDCRSTYCSPIHIKRSFEKKENPVKLIPIQHQ